METRFIITLLSFRGSPFRVRTLINVDVVTVSAILQQVHIRMCLAVLGLNSVILSANETPVISALFCRTRTPTHSHTLSLSHAHKTPSPSRNPGSHRLSLTAGR